MKVNQTQKRIRQTLLAVAAAGVLIVPALAGAQQMPGGLGGHEMPDRPQRPAPPKPTPISGTATQYIYGPRGEIEGVVLKTGDQITQVNFPPGIGTLASTITPIGKDAKLLGRPLPPPPPGREGPAADKADHEVIEFAGLDTGDATPPATAPAADAKVEGTVAALNYGRRGEVNGAILDTGDVVDVGPREAADLKLAVGRKISATGDANPIAGGHTMIAAKDVNGEAIRPHREHAGERPGERGTKGLGSDDKDFPPPPVDGVAPFGAGGPPPAR